MKVNVKGLVFVGFAAAILSGAAARADVDTKKIVTSQAYTDATYQAKDASAKYKVGTQGGWSEITNAITNGTNATKDVDTTSGAVTIGVATVDSFTGVNTGTQAAGDNDGKIPTARAIKGYVDDVASTANAAQTKSTANFQVGGADGAWKTVQPGTNVGLALDTSDNTKVNLTVAQTDTFENAGTNGADAGKLITAGAVKTALDDKQSKNTTNKYEVNRNGVWSDIGDAVAAGTAATRSVDSTSGAVTIGVDTVANFQNVDEEGQGGTANAGKIPTAAAVKAYVDSTSGTAASNILASLQDNTDTSHALTNAATTTALAGKQDNIAATYGDNVSTADHVVMATGNAGSVTYRGITSASTLGANDTSLVRAQDAKGYADSLIVQSATDTDTTHAPSADYVHDQLALKQDATTAVTHTANTAVGSATQPVYITTTGAAATVNVDSAPTDASSNLVTSGGVYTAIHSMPAYSIPAQKDTVCTDTTPCALVAESDGAMHWRVMAAGQGTDAGISQPGDCGDATGTCGDQ